MEYISLSQAHSVQRIYINVKIGLSQIFKPRVRLTQFLPNYFLPERFHSGKPVKYENQ